MTKQNKEITKKQIIQGVTDADTGTSLSVVQDVIALNTFYKWLKEDDIFREGYEMAKYTDSSNYNNHTVNLAKYQLARLVDAGDFKAVKFTLEHLTKEFAPLDIRAIEANIAQKFINVLVKSSLTDSELQDIILKITNIVNEI